MIRVRTPLFALVTSFLGPWPSGGQETPQPRVRAVEGVEYRVYERDGSASSLSAIAAVLDATEVLLLGEEHDDMVGHALELELFEAAHERAARPSGPERSVVLSLEMFERDVQYVVDEYLLGLISETHFLESARPWDDYRARYRPLVEAAKDRGARVIAANAPRRYVNRVTREGPRALEALSGQARASLPPLPYPGPSDVYREQWNRIMADAAQASAAELDSEAVDEDEVPEPPDEGHGVDTLTVEGATAGRDYAASPNAIHAQALWDAAMGHSIVQSLVRDLGALVVHIAGSFHVAHGTGIPERIADYRPGTRVTTVVITKAQDVSDWKREEHEAVADFVILTKTPGSSRP